MKLPTHFYHNKKKWTVDEVAEALDDQYSSGLCDLDDRNIQVNEWLSPTEKVVAFSHEFLHSLEDLGIKLPHPLIYKLEAQIAKLVIMMIKANC